MNIGIFITVRSGSSRLKNKALKLVEDEPIIGYLIKRMKYAYKQYAEIFICTTEHPQDQVFRKIAQLYGISIFFGDENNLIKRHFDCAQNNNIDFIINIDGDDILCNPQYVSKIIKLAQENVELDIIETQGLPFGTNVKGYKKHVLQRILQNNQSDIIDTGWGELITADNEYNHKILPALESEKMDDLRLTLDYEEDFQLFEHLIKKFKHSDLLYSQEKILEYVKAYPKLKEMNSNRKEEYWKNYEKKKKEESVE